MQEGRAKPCAHCWGAGHLLEQVTGDEDAERAQNWLGRGTGRLDLVAIARTGSYFQQQWLHQLSLLKHALAKSLAQALEIHCRVRGIQRVTG